MFECIWHLCPSSHECTLTSCQLTHRLCNFLLVQTLFVLYTVTSASALHLFTQTALLDRGRKSPLIKLCVCVCVCHHHIFNDQKSPRQTLFLVPNILNTPCWNSCLLIIYVTDLDSFVCWFLKNKLMHKCNTSTTKCQLTSLSFVHTLI